MSLPLPWVEKIFKKLSVNFGREFLAKWEGVPIAEVKEDWALELGCFAQNLEAICYGLEQCLMGKPPTVQEFKAACLRRPGAPAMAQLTAPSADPERVDAELARLAQLRVNAPQHDDKEWAKKILARHARGEQVPVFALTAAQQVAGAEGQR